MWNGKLGNDNNCLKADDSLKSFLFTLKNPHNISARRFALKDEMTHQATNCDSKCGSCFGCYPTDIAVLENCDANTGNFTSIGFNYTNDTGLNKDEVFTGSKYFQVKEIEVLEITE
jgi:hypothetical protein